MRAAFSFIFICLCLGASFSCSAQVEGFALEEVNGGLLPLLPGSREGWKEPGDIFPAPGSRVVFRFDRPLTLKDGYALFLGFQNSSGGLDLEALQSEDNRLTAAARIPLFAAAEGGVSLMLPPGTYGGFAVNREPRGQPALPGAVEPAVRVLRAAIIPYEPAFRLSPSGGIYASSAIMPGAAGPSTGKSRVTLPHVREDAEYSLRITLQPAAADSPSAPPAPANRPPRIEARGGARSFAAEITARPVPETLWLHSRFLGFVPREIEIERVPPGAGLEILLVPRPEWGAASSSFAPVPADIGMILYDPASGPNNLPGLWRHPDFEVFRWSLFPRVFIVDSRTYAVQKRLFHRLAFFVEKTGFRGKLHPDSRIWSRHGWNAHNYNAEGLAAFFNAARETGFPLNAEETWLAGFLVSQGVLREEGRGFVPGSGGVLGVSREAPAAARNLLLTHEAFHGVYYGLPEFRGLVEKTWENLPEEQKEFWRFYFTWMGYDIGDQYLLVNEFQAYLLQQPLPQLEAQYKGVIAGRLCDGHPERRAWLASLFDKYPDMFSRPARLFSDYLERAAGIQAGNVESLRIEY
ncbi:MAG: hypothetical protein LBQ57_09730 [Spirochaetales bacterium]|jgi:hypothetical protein|nr:hypothetical protein [Spirochaetales bacterium]